MLEAAVLALEAAGFSIKKRSAWWRSASWPDASRPPYLNGVLIAETDLSPEIAMARLHGLEQGFGRLREQINAPRSLDLDLIAYGRRLGETPTTPHPRAADRLFVMGPLAEIAPRWVHPSLGRSAAELAAAATVGLDAAPV